MRILVFAKQIPDVNKVGFDPETKRIIRENVPLSINSFDKRAVEEAIRIKERHSAETIVATLGPPQAKEIINESMKMGIDRGVVITDKVFAGSDTLVTSKILSKLISIMKPDIVLMGKYSLDGETSQVPPEVATLSGYNFISSISKIEFPTDEEAVRVEQDNESGITEFQLSLPAVFSVSEKINRARAVEENAPDKYDLIETYDSKSLGIEISGVDDSPTVVIDTEKNENFRDVKFLEFNDEVFDKLSDVVSEALEEKGEQTVLTLRKPEKNVKYIWGIALDDPVISNEIASKISELAVDNALNVKIIGNIEPVSLEGMLCHEYLHLKTDDNEAFADKLESLITEERPEYIVFPSTINGREIAGRIAAGLNLGLTADCIDLKIEGDEMIQYKPAFGGGLVAKIRSKTKPQMATVRPGMFKMFKSASRVSVKSVEVPGSEKYRKLGTTLVPSEYTPLSSSKIILGIGRGIKSKGNLPNVLQLARKLKASIGASRPIVDMRFVPRQQQIGITGSSISPKIYFALGISGKDNHVVGIRYAEKIIAVNSDREAEIFRFADYGIVADMNEFVRKYIEYLSKRSD